MNRRWAFRWTMLGLLVLGTTAGCRYNPEELQAFLLQPRAHVTGTDYRVMPPDGIQVTSLHVPEIAGTHRIAPNGKVNLPLLGEIYIANMTTKEIEQTLMEAAKEYYEQVDATVQVTGYNSQRFYVFQDGGGMGGAGGGGGSPGSGGARAYTGRDALLDVLSQLERRAWHERITVLRVAQPAKGGYIVSKKSKKYEWWGIHPDLPGKPRYKMTFNLKAMYREGDMSNNILLKPDDIVWVPMRPWASFAQWVRDLVEPVSPILELIRTPNTIRYGFQDVYEQSQFGGEDRYGRNE